MRLFLSSTRRHIAALAVVVLSGVLVPVQVADAQDQKYPDVIKVSVRNAGASVFNFDVTISSPYDTPQRYADAFRVMAQDGSVFGERILLHDHASEQPFTRDLYGVRNPSATKVVVVQARDKRFGYGGKTVEVALPAR